MRTVVGAAIFSATAIPGYAGKPLPMGYMAQSASAGSGKATAIGISGSALPLVAVAYVLAAAALSAVALLAALQQPSAAYGISVSGLSR